MKLKFIEATNRTVGGINWGKFGVGQFESTEWAYTSQLRENDPFGMEISKLGLLEGRGWGQHHIFVIDLQTGEGAMFRHGGLASSDLNTKHQIWVCPLFEPFLTWLYRQDVSDLDALPGLVELDAPSSMHGYRRKRTGLPRSLYERAQLRPANFAEMTPEKRWAVDKELGILDWDGTDDRDKG